MLRVHSTLTRAVQPFVPREEGKATIYLCGPTVQSEPHVGHGRSAVAFDVIRRYLDWRGYGVTFVRNITDIEDKIIAAAQEAGEPVEALAEKMAAAFEEGYAALGVLAPDYEPKATEHIPEIIGIIERLIDRGLAYQSEGDVYYSVLALESYGKLSGARPEDLRSGVRIEVEEAKHDPLDFALWKGAKPGEPWWESPWGPGRPGWHIECSAMAAKYLGNGFDIHGGGTDLIFPHHENEIAQSEGASGDTFARYWLHNGMVNLDGEKMSKSTGVLTDLTSVVKRHGGRPLRFLFLRAHYRSPIDYTEELLHAAAEALDRLDRFRKRSSAGEPDPDSLTAFTEVMDEDFGTPGAISLMFDLVREGNKLADEGADTSGIAGAIEVMVDVLGIDDASLPSSSELDLGKLAEEHRLEGSPAEMVDQLIEIRDQARIKRDFAAADAIREELEAAGVILEDGPHGTRWLRE